MTTIPGASQYLNASTLANSQGVAAAQSNVLAESGVADVLEAARVDNGIGLSARSRALTKQFLETSGSGFNQIFSLNGVEFGTDETLQQAILALRAKVPESRLAPSLREDTSENDSSARGEIVDETV